MMKARRLKGHKAALTCCIASPSRPGIVISSSEDGSICFFDLRSGDDAVLTIADVAHEAISSLCFKSGNEDIVYASSGTQILCFDVHMASTWKSLETYNYNKEEINQIAFSQNSYFLAAADDSGDVKIIDTRQQCLYKTLRAVHTSTMLGKYLAGVCAEKTVWMIIPKFLQEYWTPGSRSITGGLDSKLAMWDFSKGRAYKVVNYGMPELDNEGSSSNVGQSFNPAFVHSVAVPEKDALSGLNKVCAVARGDGVVDVMELESEKSRTSSHGKKSQLRSNDIGKRVQLDYSLGGHTAAVSCVSFSLFGEKGRLLVSGGNDASVKLWDWSKHFYNDESSSNIEPASNIDVKRKVNWLCTTPSDSDNIIVCDTSKILKAYTAL